MTKRFGKSVNTEKDSASAPVIRCDLLPHHMNCGKQAVVMGMLSQWREGAALVARIQWRLFQETGRFDKQADAATSFRQSYARPRLAILEAIVDHHKVQRRPPLKKGEKAYKPRHATPEGLVDPLSQAKATLGASPVQMVRQQVVGMLEGFVSNLQKNFVALVYGSSLTDVTRHMLFAVNLTRNWFRLDRTVTIKRDGERLLVPNEVRLLARVIWRRVMSMHRKPSTKRIGMVLDQRAVKLLPARKADSFPIWLRMSFFGKAKPIEIPLQSYPFFEARKGERKLTVQVSQDHETKRLPFGVVTDIGAECEINQLAYKESIQVPSVPLDFGLTTLFASDRGDLLGRGFLRKLKAMDATLVGIARHFQRSNPKGKVRDSKRYRHHVQRIRGFIETEIGRVLNRLVETMRPGELVLEGLDFRSPHMSRSMNRLIQNCGRARINSKLVSLEEELGITSTVVDPAYTSQTCHGCGYVDSRNRRTQSRFACHWCGLKLHADVNAARNIGERRSRPIGSGWVSKAQVLDALVRRHVERWPSARADDRTGRPGAPADPRLGNSYFKDNPPKARSPAANANSPRKRIAA